MKRVQKMFIRLCVALIVVSGLAACGGGGGGGTVNGGLQSGTFIKTIEPSHTGSFIYPLRTNPYSRDQQLVLASDIKGSGYIGSVSFRLANAVVSPVTCSHLTVKMGHTLLTGLTPTFASNVEQGQGSLATVRNSAPFTVPVGAAGDYFTINFDTPFYYNGVDNLVAEFIGAGGCSSDVPLTYSNMTNGSLVTVTDGSPTGTQNTTYLNMKLSFKGGDDLAYYGSYGSYVAPFTSNTALRHAQMLHPAATIDGSGPITGIGMVVAAPTTGGTYTATIKLGHAVRSALTTTYADNFDHGSPVTVANNVVFTVPANIPAGSTLWLPITGSFTYNGTDHLIVDINVTDGSAVVTEWAYTLISGSSVVGASGNSTGAVDAGALHTKFRFYGGTMDAMTPGNATYSLPFTTGSSAKVQSYYDATMMGSGGTINKIAFRLRFDSVADTYNNVAIVMGHTGASGLTTTFADNMVDAQTVFSGTLTIPAGMKAGDWFEIPLSTTFAYDGKRSLVVQTASDAGTFGNSIVAGNAPSYTDRLAWSLDRTLPTGTLQPIVLDQRFWYSK